MATEKADKKDTKDEAKVKVPTIDAPSKAVDAKVEEVKIEEPKAVAEPVAKEAVVAPPVMTSVESVEPSVAEAVPTPEVAAVDTSNLAPDLSQPTSPDMIGVDGSDPTVIDTVDMGYTKTSSNKMLYVLVGVLALILISLVALFFYKQYTNTPEKAEVTPTPAAEVTVEKPSPIASPVNDEDAELADIIIEDVDADLEDIEVDLKAL